jgi:hypothetical protein
VFREPSGPNPKQKNYASPLEVDTKLYKTWEKIVGDVRALVAGETGISLAALWKLSKTKGAAPTGFIDIGAMLKTPKDVVYERDSIDRIEVEKNPKKRAELITKLMKDLLGNGFKDKMKASPITDRLIELRKTLDKKGGDELVEDKLKYLFWIN